MRVLVTWGSKRGGTEGIAKIVAEELVAQGFEVEAAPVDEVGPLDPFDAVIIGGALYANRWTPNARRFVRRRTRELRKRPVWMFSSGPLDDSAETRDIPPPSDVEVLAERVGAKGHMTFGGRLEPNAEGFPASAMAKENAGDWRNPEQIRAWAAARAAELPGAEPGAHVNFPAHGFPRVFTYPVVGWALCGATMVGMMEVASMSAAIVVHAIVAPLLFAALAWHYFRSRGSREPLPIAGIWVGTVFALDFGIVAGAIMDSFEMFTSFAGTWLPLLLIFFTTWLVGAIMAMAPWEFAEQEAASKEASAP